MNVYSRNILKFRHPLPDNCRYVSTDCRNGQALNSILLPHSDVVDLAYATVPKTSFEDPLFDISSNLQPSVTLLQQASRAGIHRLVIVSSGGAVYGPAETLPISERHRTMPVRPYGITKLAVDCYAMMYHHTCGLPVTIVRPGNAYGEDQPSASGQGFIRAAIDAILNGDEINVYGERGTVRDYVHVADVASGIACGLSSGRPGVVYNIGTGIGTSNLDIISLLRPLAQDAGFDVRFQTQAPRSYDVEENVLDASLLAAHCGWAPTVSLKDGVEQMWKSALSRKQKLVGKVQT